MLALPAPVPATPAFCAFSLACFTMSGLYSMPIARAPNFRAAMIAILPSPAPRSHTKSFGVTCAMVKHALDHVVGRRHPDDVLAGLADLRLELGECGAAKGKTAGRSARREVIAVSGE